MALRMKEVIGMVLRKRLRELVEAEEILILPGAYDALSAKLVQAAGFRAVYLTGYGQSASKLGEPDVGLMCMSEMAERTRDIAMAVDIPVACDADTGFGSPVNVIRTVREYERAGAAAIQLEDQTMPKKCGHMLGRQVVPAEEMAEKIRAAAAARGDPDFLIIARTDARTEHGIDEAIRRGRLYEEAGADIIFIESLETVDEMKRVNREIRKPTIANMVEGGRTPFLPASLAFPTPACTRFACLSNARLYPLARISNARLYPLARISNARPQQKSEAPPMRALRSPILFFQRFRLYVVVVCEVLFLFALFAFAEQVFQLLGRKVGQIRLAVILRKKFV